MNANVEWLGAAPRVEWLGETFATKGECYTYCNKECYEKATAFGAGIFNVAIYYPCVVACQEIGCPQYPEVATMLKAGAVAPSATSSEPSTSAAQPSGESFPWKKFSTATKQLQESLNQKLIKDGYCALTPDGNLGPGTCGAAQHYGAAPPTCQSFTKPSKCGGGGAATPSGGGGGGATIPASPPAKGGIGTLGVVLLVGAALGTAYLVLAAPKI